MAPSAIDVSTQPTMEEKTSIFKKAGSDVKTMAIGALKKNGQSAVPTIPNFRTKEEEQKYCKEHLACAFRVFAAQGFDEGVAGHISLRDPVNPTYFWINPYAVHFADIIVSDLVCVNENAEVIVGEHAVNAAGFAIHSEIHKAHPWINAVCHSHSVYARAYSVFGKTLPPLMQDSLRFYDSHVVFEDYGGVVLSADEGKQIAKILRPQDKVALLQNHGLLTVGHTIDEAAYWYMCFEKCCQSQLMIDAASAGNGFKPRSVDHETATFTAERSGARHRGWLNFQPYYTNMVKKTNGDFLR